MTSSFRVRGGPALSSFFTDHLPVMNFVQYTEWRSFDNLKEVPAMAGSDAGVGAKALDQARRRRVVKPPDQRRREILDATTELFAVRGYDITTVQAIATKAGVAAGTVYLYFPSKEAI